MATTKQPQDATLRNVRAANRRLTALEARLRVLEERARAQDRQTDELRRMREEQDY